MNFDIGTITLRELSEAVATRKISAVDAVSAFIDRVHATRELNNFVSLCEDRAFSAAERIDAKLERGESAGALCGVPVAVKDNMRVAGLPTTCGSRLYINNIASEDAQAVRLLENAGAVIIGKTNMDELAMGSTNESSAYGAVKNVLDDSRVPGGSSGGSANAVAAKQVLCALGTDTGGSVRQPAAYCGVVGLKPTFGAIPERGLIGFVPSLDTIGITAADCDGAAVVFGVLAGKKVSLHRKSLSGITIGIADEFISGNIASADVSSVFDSAVAKLKSAGAEIIGVKIPSFAAGLTAYHILSSAEAAYHITREFDKNALKAAGGEVKRRVVAGSLVVSGSMYDELYVRAAKVRAVIKREYAAALCRCDALICPTSPTVATKLGESRDPNKTHYGDYFLAPASLAGLPAVSVPYGSGEGGMPIGIQIVGDYRAEEKILNIGKMLEL